ncbi:MAG: DUF1207 domain-containing protein [Planctomycetia bacterium]|nr:DUF1207 domain-containing protein [Planctomycetia bacterium]
MTNPAGRSRGPKDDAPTERLRTRIRTGTRMLLAATAAALLIPAALIAAGKTAATSGAAGQSSVVRIVPPAEDAAMSDETNAPAAGIPAQTTDSSVVRVSGTAASPWSSGSATAGGASGPVLHEPLTGASLTPFQDGQPERVEPRLESATPFEPFSSADGGDGMRSALAGGDVLADPCWGCDDWSWQLLPSGLIFPSYLAGPREPRISSVWLREQDVGDTWDTALGGRVGLLRYGTPHPIRPQGFELDAEGAAFPRLDLEHSRRDLAAVDFRFGLPLTYGVGNYQMKVAYYHLSSHLGDELMLRDPTIPRINYTRDEFVWGHSLYVAENVRVYGEIGYAFHTGGGAEPWELQFGLDYAPTFPTGPGGAPFVAVNAHLFEEVDFGGGFALELGWAWRSAFNGSLIRAGMHYFNGKSPQGEFFADHEEQIGFGMWYDY